MTMTNPIQTKVNVPPENRRANEDGFDMENRFKNFLRYVVTTWRSIRRKRLHRQFAGGKMYFTPKKGATGFRKWLGAVPRKLLVTTSAMLAVVLVLTIVLVATAKPQNETSGGPDKASIQGSPNPDDPSDLSEAFPDNSASPAPPPVDPLTTTIKEGMDAPVVAEIQQRLMELDYMDEDEPTTHYGPITKASVARFQRQHGLTTDGCMGADTYQKLTSASAEKYLISKGDDGTDILELQKRLVELGYMNKATNHFGADTETAVKKFQQLNGLTPDGKVGSGTHEMLYSDEAKANFTAKGESSPQIKTYQVRLQKLGYLTSTPDGKYGNATIAAVKKFQEKNGLIADGYIGQETAKRIMRADAETNDAMALGSKGDNVTTVQNRLKQLNYLKKVTGYYGSDTVNAVKAFQKRNGLSQDGKVGNRTLSVLISNKAKKAATPSSGNNTNPSTPNTPSDNDPGDTDGNSSGGVEKFIQKAKSRLGCRYVSGGKGPNTFDCSGFVYWCLNQAGVRQGYMTSATWQKCTKYERIENMSELRRGDVISFRGHVGIALGNGQMIDAGSGKGNVHYSNLNSSYWKTHFVCGFRIF